MSDTKIVTKHNANKKSQIIAYFLLFLTGWLGGHRFYLGRTGTAMILLGLSITIGPLFALPLFASDALAPNEAIIFVVVRIVISFVILMWIVVDLFRVRKMVRQYNDDLMQSLEASNDQTV